MEPYEYVGLTLFIASVVVGLSGVVAVVAMGQRDEVGAAIEIVALMLLAACVFISIGGAL